jgi:hypothetical protein
MFIKPLLGLIIGGVLGYAYYRLVGCAGGGCPLSSNPYISTVLWATFGLALMWGK